MTTAFVRRTDNLPAEVTSFVDRHAELAQIRALLDQSRLVTLTGPGGVGKTRLAVRAGRDLRRSYPDGVWLIDLTELSEETVANDAESIANVLTLALGLDGNESGLATLVTYLGAQRALLILDNCEHVIDAAAAFANLVLRRAPAIQILATSRELLGIGGELTVPVPSLPAAEGGTAQPSAAILLFTDRAGAVQPNYQPSAADVGVVGEICYRLDGLPLAIELAAVRMRALSPAQILDRLSDPYRLLTGGSRSAPERHRTLRSSIAWSAELCTPTERAVWAQMSVFVSGWELDAAEAVCHTLVAPGEFVLDVVQSLVEKSIVVREPGHDAHRYRMLETIRQFGLDELADGTVAARRRHLAWYAALLRTAEDEWITERQPQWLDRLGRELPNIRTALEFGLTDDAEAGTGIELTVTAWRSLWWAHGRVTEARRWLDQYLDRPGPTTAVRTHAMLLRSFLAAVHGDLLLSERCLVQADEELAVVADPVNRSLVSSGYGALAGDTDEAAALYERARELLGEAGNIRDLVNILVPLALLYDRLGRSDEATRVRDEAIQLTAARGERFERSHLLLHTGLNAWQRTELAEAVDWVHQSLRLKRDLGDRVGVALAEQALAAIALAGGDPRRAATLLGTADTVWRHAGAAAESFPLHARLRADTRAGAEAALGRLDFDDHFERGGLMSMIDAIAWALDELDVTPARLPSPRSATDTAIGADLTPREWEVARLVAAGHANRDIANHLTISPRTAEGHVERIRTKLGFTSRTQIVNWVLHRDAADS
jgi:non-specific serine/threonine protein kinase